MSLQFVTDQFKQYAGKAPNLGKTLKFVFPEGVIFIDMTSDEASVSNEDQEADCTISTKIETLDALRKGELNPMMAVMTGKIKIKGDMGVAMKLQSLLS
jgi:putative sterol carrier protein